MFFTGQCRCRQVRHFKILGSGQRDPGPRADTLGETGAPRDEEAAAEARPVLQAGRGRPAPQAGHQAHAEGLQGDPRQQPRDAAARRFDPHERLRQGAGDGVGLRRLRRGPVQAGHPPGGAERRLDAGGYHGDGAGGRARVDGVQEPAQRLPRGRAADAVLQEHRQQPRPADAARGPRRGREFQGSAARVCVHSNHQTAVREIIVFFFFRQQGSFNRTWYVDWVFVIILISYCS